VALRRPHGRAAKRARHRAVVRRRGLTALTRCLAVGELLPDQRQDVPVLVADVTLGALSPSPAAAIGQAEVSRDY
jgi:hypothetical protein